MFPTDALLGDGVVTDDECTEAALVPPSVPVVGEFTANARVTWIRNRMLRITISIAIDATCNVDFIVIVSHSVILKTTMH